MYAITKIDVYNMSPEHLGDEASEADAKGYREYLTEKLKEQFPGAEISVSDAPNTYQFKAEIDGEEEIMSNGFVRHNEEISEFLEECWNSCGWEWAA